MPELTAGVQSVLHHVRSYIFTLALFE